MIIEKISSLFVIHITSLSKESKEIILSPHFELSFISIIRQNFLKPFLFYKKKHIFCTFYNISFLILGLFNASINLSISSLVL